MPDILLKDRDGVAVTYEGVETVTFDTPEQEKGATFTYGIPVENVEVSLDMASGNQNVSVPYGTLVKSAIILKPDTLIPENIKKDVVITGVTGTMEESTGGGSGDFDFTDTNLKYFSYQIDNNANQIMLCSILYDKLYEETGSYDVTIPDTIGGYAVVIKAN